MRLFATFIVAGLMATSSAQAATIVGLCNTGTTAAATGCTTTATGPDANWKLNGTLVPFANNGIHPNWAANSAVSRWITPASNPNQTLDPSSNGLYDYSLKFDLTGFKPGTASFLGRFMVDNTVTAIVLNGTTLAASGGGFTTGSWTGFGANGGFVSGLNTLTFKTLNQAQRVGNPAGLRVEFTSSAIAAVPEPATWAMMILGFGLIGGAMRSRKTGVTTRIAYA
jgi:hypothetical protein